MVCKYAHLISILSTRLEQFEVYNLLRQTLWSNVMFSYSNELKIPRMPATIRKVEREFYFYKFI